jgi:hypothetical protein
MIKGWFHSAPYKYIKSARYADARTRYGLTATCARPNRVKKDHRASVPGTRPPQREGGGRDDAFIS